MKTRLTNPANFLIMAIMVAAIFIFSCSSGGDGCTGDDCYAGGISSPSGGNSSSSKRQLPDLGNSSSSKGSSSSNTGTGNSSSSSVTAGGGTSSSGTSSSSGGNTSCTDNSSGAGPSLAYEGKTYKTVKIGCQTWMAENLDYAVEGSKCGNGSTLSDANTTTCDTYGRLYNWATAMALSSSCNSSTCSNLIQPKHRGVCPSGWHIPSNAEWDALYRFADGTSGTSSPYDSPTAGKHLKAKDGWNSCGPSGSGESYSCEDTYGFAALPGGYGDSDGSFYDAGSIGYWWSASTNSYYAYSRYMYYLGGAFWRNRDKPDLFSVRCVKDD